MSRIRLIAASDDYLLEDRLAAGVATICSELGGVEAEIQSDEATPESVAMELVSPSLFAAERVLVVEDARTWVGGAAPAGLKVSKTDPPDPEPLIHVLDEGVPEGVALVMGAWCGRKPGGKLVEAIERAGRFDWIPLPAAPKPWDDVVISSEQRQVLEAVLRRAAGGVDFTPSATGLLLERLGFAPRLLVQEVHKLTGAAGDGPVHEDLVRRLTFPRERSLEVVRDSVLKRELEPLLDLVAAAGSGAPINDWRGQRMDPEGFAPTIVSQVANLQLQLLYLRRVAEGAGLAREMAPEQTGREKWYPRFFKDRIAPDLIKKLKEDAPSPVIRQGTKAPTPFSLGGLFKGAGRYSTDELVAAVADAGKVEARIRQKEIVYETLTVWLTAFVGRDPG
jgi:hypothetical protein